MNSPRDQEIVSWWGWGKFLLSSHFKSFSFMDFFYRNFQRFFYLGFNEITTRPGDCLVVGVGEKIFVFSRFFHNETTRLSHGGDGVREIFISSKIQIQRNP